MRVQGGLLQERPASGELGRGIACKPTEERRDSVHAPEGLDHICFACAYDLRRLEVL